jgi:hypothetical protein
MALLKKRRGQVGARYFRDPGRSCTRAKRNADSEGHRCRAQWIHRREAHRAAEVTLPFVTHRNVGARPMFCLDLALYGCSPATVRIVTSQPDLPETASSM